MQSSNLSKRPEALQEITDIITIHADQVQDYLMHLHDVWSTPFLIGIALFGLYLWTGYAAFFGLLLMVIIVFVVSVIQPALTARVNRNVREPAAKEYHEVMQSTLKGIKVDIQ